MHQPDRSDLVERGIPEDQSFEHVMDRQIERRDVLRGGATLVPMVLAPAGVAGVIGAADDAHAAIELKAAALNFAPVAENSDDKVTVPTGYVARPLLRWGDPLRPGLPAFDINNQSPADQAQRVGFNHDSVAVFPLPYGSPATTRAGTPHPSYLVCINHEYTTGLTMFPDYPTSTATTVPSANTIRTEIEAHGITVAELRLGADGNWTYDVNSAFNRRITGSTEFKITGPAAGDDLLKTSIDPTGTKVFGTFNNCAGGFTPWGTYMAAEENIDQYFANRPTGTDVVSVDAGVFGIVTGNSSRRWEAVDPRFDMSKPEGRNEPFRFGWIVEIDPYTPGAVPKKRTSMGRFKHEACQVALNGSGRVVAYTGDDQAFEYVYKFIASKSYFAGDRASNMDLLDEGTLYVARFDDNGTGAWLPVTFENINAIAPGKFRNQADVLIRCRQAADLLGATPMDRPEDVEPIRDANMVATGKVYVVMTKNAQRVATSDPAQVALAKTVAPRGRSALTNAANPRGSAASLRVTNGVAALASSPTSNVSGHIIEIREANDDVASLNFTWSIFLLAGDTLNPASPAVATGAAQNVSTYNGITYTMIGDRLGCPDNIAFDNGGNLWIATDGNPDVFKTNDSVYATATNQGWPHAIKRFLTGPFESEICGPTFSPDNTTFFVAIQHPGELGPVVPRSGTNPTSRWPDGDYPRPSLVAVRRADGGRIGS